LNAEIFAAAQLGPGNTDHSRTSHLKARVGFLPSFGRIVGDPETPRRMGRLGLAAARTLAAAAYYEELERANAR